jgi:hypothetical protein
MLKYYMLIAVSFILVSAQAQIQQSGIHKKVNDPDTKKNAAKADRQVVRNRMIFDSTIIRRQKLDTVNARKSRPQQNAVSEREKGKISF